MYVNIMYLFIHNPTELVIFIMKNGKEIDDNNS